MIRKLPSHQVNFFTLKAVMGQMGRPRREKRARRGRRLSPSVPAFRLLKVYCQAHYEQAESIPATVAPAIRLSTDGVCTLTEAATQLQFAIEINCVTNFFDYFTGSNGFCVLSHLKSKVGIYFQSDFSLFCCYFPMIKGNSKTLLSLSLYDFLSGFQV